MSEFVDIGHLILVEEQFCIVLEDDLVVLVVEPKEMRLASFVQFSHPDGHNIFLGFLESLLLYLDDLVTIQPIFVDFLLGLQLFLVVRDYLEFLQQTVRH